ncbi:DUF7948 domain-containing protein [Taibaiella koreensis]|uniref:DUF7948 domain-containing protein n=1 Tax=Taibaiella koreensis TaxID=1268548 RepID=UPI000E59AEB9|nr:gliding motility-associated C-terminal domain-containing protein [Taibaiella koreensis]
MKSIYCLVAFFLISQIVCARSGPEPYVPGSLAFRENVGQITDQRNHPRKDIQFQLSTDGLSVFIGKGKIHYQWNEALPAKTTTPDATAAAIGKPAPPSFLSFNTYRLDVTLLDCNTDAPVIKEEQLPDATVYYAYGLNGARAASWHKITYQNIYPNIDWVLYTRGSELKYDFVLHPGARAGDIKMRYDGAGDIAIKDGMLVATTPMGSIKEEKPFSYKKNSGDTVTSRFVLDKDIAGFEVGAYEGTLVIDPALRLQWATYYGGSGTESGQYAGHSFYGYYAYGNSVITDHNGDVYISGTTSSIDNIATLGTHQVTLSNGSCAYLARFTASGQRVWGTYFGGYNGSLDEDGAYMGTVSGRGHSIACDTLGNIYMAGNTFNDSGIATPGAYQMTRNGIHGWPDLYLVKFRNDGTRQWSTYLGNPRIDEGGSVAVTKDGSKIYLAGASQSFLPPVDVIASPGAFLVPPGPGSALYSGFLTCFNAQGQRRWGTYIADVENILSTVYDIALDKEEHIYITGYVIGDGISTAVSAATIGSFQSQYGGCTFSSWGPPNCTPDAFLQKWDSAGHRLWGTYYGGNAPDGGYTVACDDSNNVYMAGYTSPFTNSINGTWSVASPGGFLPTIPPDGGSFLAKFSGQGQRRWGTYYYGNNAKAGAGLACKNNKIFLLVSSDAVGLATPCAYQTDNPGLFATGGSVSAYLSIFDTAGNREYATYYGGAYEDWGCSLAATNTEKGIAVYATGTTTSPTRIATAGSFKNVLGGQLSLQRDAFLAKFIMPVTEQVVIPCFSRDSVQLKAYDTSGTNYAWDHGVSGFSTEVSTSGTYVVRYRRADGCPDADTFNVKIYPLPVLTALEGCPAGGMAVAAVAPGNSNTYTYNWYDDAGTLIRTMQRNKGDTAEGLSAGHYKVQVLAADCDTTLPFTIETFPEVVLDVSNDTTIAAGQKVQLWATGANLYRWQPEDGLDNPAVARPVAAPRQPVTYTVTGYSEHGCKASLTVHIDIHDAVFMPNAFSPNGDGINDVFKIGNYGYHKLAEFRVFNRWGQEVFFTTDPAQGWNGQYKKQPADVGTYHYYARLRTISGEEKVFKGDITLVR